MELVGKYKHEKSENLDAYFKAVGVPYLLRIMICKSSPEIEISMNNDEWTISSKSLMRTAVKTFTMGEPYEEQMPGTKLKSTSILENGKLVTKSTSEDGQKTKQIYEIEDKQMIMTLFHETSGVEAKRYFNRVVEQRAIL